MQAPPPLTKVEICGKVFKGVERWVESVEKSVERWHDDVDVPGPQNPHGCRDMVKFVSCKIK
jgi:hypothetical protein